MKNDITNNGSDQAFDQTIRTKPRIMTTAAAIAMKMPATMPESVSLECSRVPSDTVPLLMECTTPAKTTGKKGDVIGVARWGGYCWEGHFFLLKL